MTVPTTSAEADPFDEPARRALHAALVRVADATEDALDTALDALYAIEIKWRGSHPLSPPSNAPHGRDALLQEVWRPLKRALPDLERRDDILIFGRYEGCDYLGALGHYCGTFERDWLGIPATAEPLFLRYGEVHRVVDGRVVDSHCLWDVLDAIRQAGFWPIAPSLGREGRWPGPLTADGLRLRPSAPAAGAANLAQTLAMHATLGAHDDRTNLSREALLSMPQKQHWHPKMMWYGPSGIGTTRALAGFVDRHQLPFRRAFPGRKGGGQWDDIAERKAALGGGHYVRIGDGPYSLTSGWPSVYAVHEGGDFLGLGPTGREVGMRVMDFYLHHDGLIRENWVPIDVVHVLLQLGVDVLDRLQTAFARGAR